MKALGSDVSESEYRITGIHVRGLDCDETQQCESNMHEQQQKAEDIVLKEFAVHNFPLHKKGLPIPLNIPIPTTTHSKDDTKGVRIINS